LTPTRPRIAVFAGPTATILNTAPLVTSNQARSRRGLPPLADEHGEPLRFDALRPQRLAAPVTVYVEQHSAHPLERDAAALYGPPDGYVDRSGAFHPERTSPDDVPVYEVVLRPEDGLLALPYMATQTDGSPWDDDAIRSGARPDEGRQPFFPDAARLFEEIDRFGVDEHGVANVLSSQADFEFHRVIPPGGYTAGRTEAERTDLGSGDIAPERIWEDFFPYRPYHLRREPPRGMLALLTNRVHRALEAESIGGAVWLEGSPMIEETAYWLGLLIDTRVPIVACASPDFPHGVVGASGDRHIVDAVRYIASRIWVDDDGRDRIGAVLLSSEQLFAARDVYKADARPGGYATTGGHGGIVGTTGEPGPPVLTYVPVWRHTWRSEVRLTELPREVEGVMRTKAGIQGVPVAIRDESGDLLPGAIPFVSFHKHARYLSPDASVDPASEVELLARIDENLRVNPLAGFVVEGAAPYGSAGQTSDALLRRATFLGMPVVRTSRGIAEGFVARERVKLGIAGSNLTAPKARLLLMACLMRFGALPVAQDPDNPTADEIAATNAALERYQVVFETH
jgi:L-asparaginase